MQGGCGRTALDLEGGKTPTSAASGWAPVQSVPRAAERERNRRGFRSPKGTAGRKAAHGAKGAPHRSPTHGNTSPASRRQKSADMGLGTLAHILDNRQAVRPLAIHRRPLEMLRYDASRRTLELEPTTHTHTHTRQRCWRVSNGPGERAVPPRGVLTCAVFAVTPQETP